MASVIYIDTSVVLARLLEETRKPPATLFQRTLISSRLLEYECWNRVHARKLAPALDEALNLILSRISFVELAPPVLRYAKDPWNVSVRTLDTLHLSTLRYLVEQGLDVELATYDSAMLAAAVRNAIRATELV